MTYKLTVEQFRKHMVSQLIKEEKDEIESIITERVKRDILREQTEPISLIKRVKPTNNSTFVIQGYDKDDVETSVADGDVLMIKVMNFMNPKLNDNVKNKIAQIVMPKVTNQSVVKNEGKINSLMTAKGDTYAVEQKLQIQVPTGIKLTYK